MTTREYALSSESHEFPILSWWAAKASGTDQFEMVDEVSDHRIVWGLRTGSPAVSVPWGKKGQTLRASVRLLGDTVGVLEKTARRTEICLRVPVAVGIDKVTSEARARYDEEFDNGGIPVYYARKFSDHNANWVAYGSLPKRRISTVALADGLEKDLLSDARAFLAKETQRDYDDYGRPYKRVYCLYGPPGTGKTTTIMAIASELDKPVAIFNVDSLRDDTFLALMSDLPKGAVVIFEDVDAMFKSRSVGGGEGADGGDGGMTFSTLLNTLDGTLHPRGSLVFLTTNHIERMDPALHRPGRVDRLVEVPYARAAQVGRMWAFAFPKSAALPRELGAAADRGVSPALTSEVLFRHRNDRPAAAKAALLEAWRSSSRPESA